MVEYIVICNYINYQFFENGVNIIKYAINNFKFMKYFLYN